MYEHYIALDWSKSNMAIARITKKGKKAYVEDIPSNISYLKDYLKNLKGKKILTFEESTSSQWLYSELKSCVSKLLVCDPYRNHLLSEGAKNDKIDATKLVYLNKAGLLKEVYHSGDDFIDLRKLVSGYNDVVKSLVRLKNQRFSVFQSVGLDHKTDEFSSTNISDDFVLSRSEQLIAHQER
ncbi:MAG: transposase, partial [Bdellovibrionales bacterium]|nr:transposase [Bdellovibrionales bacterium]